MQATSGGRRSAARRGLLSGGSGLTCHDPRPPLFDPEQTFSPDARFAQRSRVARRSYGLGGTVRISGVAS